MNRKMLLFADFVGIVTLPLKILCFHLASAKEEYSLFTTSA
jgi:hypothetical protein